MNEWIFLFHLVLSLTITLFAAKKGRTTLIVWTALQPVLANLFVLKEISLFGVQATCADVYAVSNLLGINLLREYFSADDAADAIKNSFIMMILFIIMSKLHLAYTPSALDCYQPSYSAILSPAPRLLIASSITYFIVQQFDIRLFSFLKNRLHKSSFGVRTAIALLASQLLDTALFTVLGLYGLVPHLVEIFITSFCIKTAICLLYSTATLQPKTSTS